MVTTVTPDERRVGADARRSAASTSCRGRNKNTVVFKRDGGKAVFVKADDRHDQAAARSPCPRSSRRVQDVATARHVPTRFRMRVLAEEVRQEASPRPRSSPLIALEPAPRPPPDAAGLAGSTSADGDCDGDGVVNRVDTDDDNDLLPDDARERSRELASTADPAARPTPTATASRTATSTSRRATSTTTSTSSPNAVPAVPGQAAVPEPARTRDADTDYDGDALTLGEEYALWKYTYARPAATATLDAADLLRRRAVLALRRAWRQRPPRAGAARRRATTSSAEFVRLGQRHGYRQVVTLPARRRRWTYDRRRRRTATTALFDVDRSTATSARERYYYDFDARRLAVRRRARRGRRRPHQLRRDARPHDRRLLGGLLHRRDAVTTVAYAGTEPRRRRHRRRRRARRRRRPGPRRHPERHGAEPERRRPAVTFDDPKTKKDEGDPSQPDGPGQPVQPVPAGSELADLPDYIPFGARLGAVRRPP